MSEGVDAETVELWTPILNIVLYNQLHLTYSKSIFSSCLIAGISWSNDAVCLKEIDATRANQGKLQLV